MTRRQRAFWMVTVPVAAMLAMNDRILGAQEPIDQPMVSRSGHRAGVARQDRRSRATTSISSPAAAGSRSHPVPADQPRYGRFDELQERNNAILRDILEEAAKPAARADLQEDRRLLRELHGRDRRSRPRALAPLAAGARPRRRDQVKPPTSRRSSATCTRSAFAPFFGFGAAPDFKDATQYIADVRPGRARRCPTATTT